MQAEASFYVHMEKGSNKENRLLTVLVKARVDDTPSYQSFNGLIALLLSRLHLVY